MLSSPDGPFINLSRLNLSKYAQKNTLSRSLFEYILYHDNDVRHVSLCTKYSQCCAKGFSGCDVCGFVLAVFQCGIR